MGQKHSSPSIKTSDRNELVRKHSTFFAYVAVHRSAHFPSKNENAFVFWHKIDFVCVLDTIQHDYQK